MKKKKAKSLGKKAMKRTKGGVSGGQGPAGFKSKLPTTESIGGLPVFKSK